MNRWYKTDKVPWLPECDLQADVLDDLRTKCNELSVYFIDDNESNLDRVIAALAANTNTASNIDFAVFGQEILSEIDIKIKKSRGELSDDLVNACHNDLCELSAPKLLELAIIIKAKARIDRKGPKQILNLVADSIIKGRIDRKRINWEKSDMDKVDEVISTHKSRTTETR